MNIRYRYFTRSTIGATVLAVALGIGASPASATAGVQRISNGTNVFWGPYTQVTWNKDASNKMFSMRGAGDAAAAIAAWACGKIPILELEAGCIVALAKNYSYYRVAIDNAHSGGSNSCVAMRVYVLGYASTVAPSSTAVDCVVPGSSGGGSGGGGGGGGGGSWRGTR